MRRRRADQTAARDGLANWTSRVLLQRWAGGGPDPRPCWRPKHLAATQPGRYSPTRV